MTIHEAVVMLSPWTQHHPRCARLTSAGECDCGLQKALIILAREATPQLMPRRSLDVVASTGCKVTTEKREG